MDKHHHTQTHATMSKTVFSSPAANRIAHGNNFVFKEQTQLAEFSPWCQPLEREHACTCHAGRWHKRNWCQLQPVTSCHVSPLISTENQEGIRIKVRHAYFRWTMKILTSISSHCFCVSIHYQKLIVKKITLPQKAIQGHTKSAVCRNTGWDYTSSSSQKNCHSL